MRDHRPSADPAVLFRPLTHARAFAAPRRDEDDRNPTFASGPFHGHEHYPPKGGKTSAKRARLPQAKPIARKRGNV
jgi:hypothetical protein